MTKATSEIIAAFTDYQAERLTGVSIKQLRSWDSSGFFVPSLAEENRRSPYSRVYSFRDIVSLKVLNELRNNCKVSLQHLKEVKNKLSHLGEDLWSKTTLYVHNRCVVFENPETNNKEEVVSGQGVFRIVLEVVTGDLQKSVRELNRRTEKNMGKITKKKGVIQNAPIILGTRIPVSVIKSFYEDGYTIGEILLEYPTLTTEDIEAAIEYKEAS